MKCSYPNIKLLQLDCYLSAASRTWIENLLPSPKRDGLGGQHHHQCDYFLKPSGSIILRCFWDIQYYNDDYFTIITIIGPTINRSDASPKSRRMERDGSFPLDCYDYQTDYFDYTNICPGTAQESGTQVLWEPSSQRWKKNIFLLNVVRQENTFHDPPSRDWKWFAITHKNNIFSPQKNCFVRRYVIGENVQVKRVDAKLKERKKS